MITRIACALLVSTVFIGSHRAKAQAPVSYLRTDGILGVFAGNSIQQSLDHQRVDSSLQLSQRALRGSREVAHASSLATVTSAGCRIEIDVTSLGHGARCGTTSTRSANPMEQRYAFVTRAGTAQLADVYCRYRGSVTGSALTAASIQTNAGDQSLVADGTIRSFTIPGLLIRAIENPIRISADAQCSASSAARVTWDIAIELRPVTRCTLRYGTRSCDTAGDLWGRIRGNNAAKDVLVDFVTRTQISSSVTAATLLVSPAPSVFGNLVGFAAPTCVLLTTPLAVVTGPVVNGSFVYPITIPPTLYGPLWFQTVMVLQVASGRIIASTNTLRLDSR